MTFNCMDINRSFLNMLGFGNSSEMTGGLSDFSKEDIFFKEQLASAIQSGQFKTANSKEGNSFFDKLISFVSKELEGLEGVDFLKKLKEFFMMLSGNNLKNLSIDAQGLDVLKELLINAGFEAEQITELIGDIKFLLTQENKNVSVDELLNKLGGLDSGENISDEIKNQEEDVIIPISALAFIESIMTSLGIPEDVRNSIFSDVKTDQGIDLNVLIKNLKEVEEKSFATGTSFKIDINTNSVAKLMSQLNLGNGSKALLDGKLSLQDFINVLENKRNEILNVGGIKDNNLTNVLATTMASKGKEVFNPQAVSKNILVPDNRISMEGLSPTDANGEKETSALLGRLFDNISKQETSNDKIVNVSLDKFSNKDFEKLFPFHIKGEPGKDSQLFAKSELEEKFTKLLVKIESSMNGKGDSENRNHFSKARHQSNAVKIMDTPQSSVGEGKLLNSVRYLSSAKNEAARPLPSYVTNQVGRSIVRAFNQGQSEIKIQLKPPELGRMMITIEDMGNGVKVSVVAEHQAARDMLISNSNTLKAALESSGISLENFDVDMGSDFNRSMADAKNQSGYSRNKKGQKILGIDGENITIDNIALAREQHLTHDGVLYYVA